MGLYDSVARELLNIQAIQVRTDDYFTWTSGIQAPIYCDNRLTMSYPNVRKQITSAFARMTEHLKRQPDVIAGCATAGIPHAAWLAERLDLPMAYVRSKPKAHGLGNQIEGQVNKGQKVLVVEDLISTGGSSIEAAKTLRDAGADVLGVAAIFTYGLQKAEQQFSAAGFDWWTITDFDAILRLLTDDGAINTNQRNQLKAWRDHL
ncbi:orotate phosphoribosyltransferase [Lentibacillus cibarius]|uniref:Orotate phosphoribosyltransferase n=2 Tax=Lentibacillus cibarius TaxID=2583219 RepID=A0A549YKC7_9BACI|nr:orotate phosphoribosyltransferase [Lentibacillus cibarius]TMN23926.1 orotate phosphoribosyltransferase [Lentibacillus cibarius]TRM12340.1 orotate phosphoribosyltransferase [Lentibacillus cibarius]